MNKTVNRIAEPKVSSMGLALLYSENHAIVAWFSLYKKRTPHLRSPNPMAEMVGFPLRGLLQHQFNCVDERLVSLCCCHSLVLPASSTGRGRTRSRLSPRSALNDCHWQSAPQVPERHVASTDSSEKEKDLTTAKSFFMAEMVGFEPTCRSSRQHDFQSCSL